MENKGFSFALQDLFVSGKACPPKSSQSPTGTRSREIPGGPPYWEGWLGPQTHRP